MRRPCHNNLANDFGSVAGDAMNIYILMEWISLRGFVVGSGAVALLSVAALIVWLFFFEDYRYDE
jgi:hypothetical protein